MDGLDHRGHPHRSLWSAFYLAALVKGGTIERDVPYPYYSAVETYTPMRYVNVID